MRELESRTKWRGKGVEDNKWHHGQLYHCTDENGVPCDEWYIDYVQVNKNTIGQYAQHDSVDKKEIYEGDYVTFEFYSLLKAGHEDESLSPLIERFEVVYDKVIGGLILKNEDFDMFIHEHDNLTVVGNIYD